MYLALKFLHICGVVAFLGNITTGIFWHVHALKTGNPALIAHTMEGIMRTDRLFTMPGVFLIVLSGVAAAMTGGLPILGTGWILWTLVLFTISGVVFMIRLAPLQRRMHELAVAGAATATFDIAAYRSLTRQWLLWGTIATLTPLAGVALMVLKPVF